ncbi:potassium channel family protein [Rhodohalobacter barkolensis]|uniref:Potassium transporter TrkA n=1 Tax=Rhodohalobacter barkolensis TaxID=2053187 RepID=A0A2N0VHD6_9BACT|nr:NAD-binding protein [Rhodohalobacter barkolensis]PKD43605.1 potassium transporter TrkA [Rhodohalobacter barkolensis]
MKFLGSQLSYFFANRRTKTNVKKLLKFVGVLFLMYVAYSITFHYVAMYEGQDHTWLTGFYWVIVTMSTLGFGDIVFTTDVGRAFSMLVLFSGVLFLLVMLPFTFIEFFYAPWMKAQNQARAPKRLEEETFGHVVITNLNAVTEALIAKLKSYKIDYVLLEPDLQKALDLSDLDYKVVNLDPTDYDTYNRLFIKNASMLVAADSDTINTNVTFTAREFSDNINIVATANSEDSVDVLKLAGANNVLQMGDILGRALARRTLGGNARVHVIGHIDNLVIGEVTVKETPLIGKTLKESKLRESLGVNVVGIWERGKFIHPEPDTMIKSKSVLVLAGTVEHLRKYDEVMSIYNVSDAPVVIIGAGRVGRAAARSMDDRQIDYRIIDKNPDRIQTHDNGKYILGDAADLSVLKKAGLENAHSVLITTHDDDVNIYLTIYCRQLKPDLEIISRATYERNVNTMHRAGADFVMSYASMGAGSIFNILEDKDVIMLAEGLNIFNYQVDSKLSGISLLESNIRQKTGCTVIAVNCKNEEMLVNPPPERVLEKDDEIVLIGSSEGEKRFTNNFLD